MHGAGQAGDFDFLHRRDHHFAGVFRRSLARHASLFNRSEEGVGYLYEVSRLAGLPSGFYASWETLLTVTAEDTDVVVLPSTRGVGEEVIAHIRALYEAGVSLIAVGRVDGLEDLFGVRYAPREVHFCGIDANGEHEAVYPFSEPARYDALDAEVLMTADGTPVLYRRDRALLYNISPAAVGRAYFYADCQNARSSISPLLRRTSIALMRELSAPTAVCTTENCGVTLFEDTNGSTMLLVIDYSAHDQAKRNTVSEKTVMLTGDTGSVDAVIDNGSVEIKTYIVGDVNRDGIVDIKDVTVLRRYLAGTTAEADVDVQASDCNGDGVVDIKDVTILRRYLAGTAELG